MKASAKLGDDISREWKENRLKQRIKCFFSVVNGTRKVDILFHSKRYCDSWCKHKTKGVALMSENSGEDDSM